MSYTHLSADERLELYQLQQKQLSKRAIARHLGRSPSTVCRELRRNQITEGIYLPDRAQQKMQQRRQDAKNLFEQISPTTVAQVKIRLKQYHSPEQIAGRLKREGQPTVSHETIYQMIYHNYQGMGVCAQYLRQSHIRRQKRKSHRSKRGLIPNRVGIEMRPGIAGENREIGHWEGDTIIGGNHLGAIATHVDKASKYLVARLMKDRTASQMNQVSIAAFNNIPVEKRRTFTFDNGKEFSAHQQLAKVLGVQCYFANPYHSWERGLNEHTNGLMRQFLPKGTSFKLVKQKQVDAIVELINHRPRKSLGYRTPHEVFWGQSGDVALQI